MPVTAVKRATNVSLSSVLIDEAKSLNVNISKACESGLRDQVARTRADRWRTENREAIEYWNDQVREHGLILDDLRLP